MYRTYRTEQSYKNLAADYQDRDMVMMIEYATRIVKKSIKKR